MDKEKKEYAPTKCECGGYFKKSKKKKNIYYCSRLCGKWYDIRKYQSK